MRKLNVLVTGIGAIIGYGIVRSLRKCQYDVNILGMDVYEDAVGRNWCDSFLKAAWASEDRYLDFLAEVIKKNNIDLVFFGLEQEIHKVCNASQDLLTCFDKLVLNDQKLINLSKDKWRMFEYLTLNNVPAIQSMIDGGYDEVVTRLGSPCIVKPRQSTASKGLMTIRAREDFEYWRHKLGSNFMAQELIGDDEHEYTVGVFGLGDGTFSQSIAFSRKLSREGSTSKAQTVDIPELNEEVERLSSLLKPIGPTNFQFRLHQGKYLLLEVNPRISSSSSLRTAFGFNEPEMCIQLYVNRTPPTYSTLKKGIAVRYIEDFVSYVP